MAGMNKRAKFGEVRGKRCSHSISKSKTVSIDTTDKDATLKSLSII